MADNIKIIADRPDIVAIANAVRNKTGQTSEMTLGEIVSGINGIKTGVDLPELSNPASASDILSDKEAIDEDGNKITGIIPSKTASNLTASEATVTVPAGYYATQATKSVATATQATPSITVSSAGLITASSTQSAGYVASGTKSATKQLTTQAAKTVTPTTSNQTAVASGVYTTGAITIKGDTNLKAENIKSGVSIFGVTGTHVGEGGGGSSPSNPTASQNEVNFYDYDGTLLYSYTVEEAQALTELPPLPTRQGLMCQGWNYDLATIKSYNRPVNVGATYITDDGKTRLYIKIAAEGRMDVPLYFSQTVSNGVTIDWGDGSPTQTLSGSNNVNTTHTYANIGDYVITLNVTSGTLRLGHNSFSYCVMGSVDINGIVYCNILQKVEIGSSVTSIGSYAFDNCYSLASIVIPDSVTNIDSSAFYCCYSLASVVISNSVTNIGSHAFYCCYSLASVVISNSVTSIGNSVFQFCCGMAIYDFTSHISVPTLSSTKAFGGIVFDCVIKVPAALYDEWTTATNWSTYASQIVAVEVDNENGDGDNSDGELIEFFIEVNTYQAESGMTWGEWCDSPYNTIGAYATDYDITVPSGGLDDEYIFDKSWDYVLYYDVIIEGYSYILSA